jgi:hypothetical protein
MKHGAEHPNAYIALIKDYMKTERYSEAANIAAEGLSKLEGVDANRAKIADLLLETGEITNDTMLVQKAVWEGFASSLDLPHFLRLYILNDAKMREKAIKHLQANKNKETQDYLYILFINGDYPEVYDVCKKDKKFLGWSYSEKGKMLPLFIALLVGTQSLPPCTVRMIKSSFWHGLPDEFIETLEASISALPDEEWQVYFEWCVAETNGRAEAIVQGQHRKSYHKIAEFIVSIAEVINAQRDYPQAISFIDCFKEKYPRHRAFQQELRECIQLAGLDIEDPTTIF